MANKVLLENHQFTSAQIPITAGLTVYGGMVSPPPFKLTIGEKYTVVWDGVEYVCTAYDGSAMMADTVYVGNASGFGLPGDESQPFIIASNDTAIVLMSLVDTATSAGNPHTASVAYEDKEYKIYHSTLYAIAESIRAKTGNTAGLSPTDMPTAIEDISGGGGGTSGDERVKYVTFMNGDTELLKYPVIAGDTCHDTVGKLTKEPTVSTVYEHTGWSLTDGGDANPDALKNVTDDRTVWAAYSSAVRYYTVTYYDDDGVTVLKTESLAYGSTPHYVPEKDGHKFTGWTTEVVTVTEDTSYTAQWFEQLSLETTTWSTIAEKSASGEASDLFALGDTKKLTLTHSDGTTKTVELELVGFNHDDLSDGSGKAGMTFITKRVLGMNEYGFKDVLSIGGKKWSTSSLKTWCNGTLLDRFPEELKPLVKEVTKKTLYYHTMTETTKEKVWVPSYQELSGNGTSDYYKSESPSMYPLYVEKGMGPRYGRSDFDSLELISTGSSAGVGSPPTRSVKYQKTSSAGLGEYTTIYCSENRAAASTTIMTYTSNIKYLAFGFCI